MSFFTTIETDFSDFAKWIESFGAEGKTISAAVVSDIQIIGSGLKGALSGFEAITGIAPETVAAITAKINAISAAALTVATTVASNIAEPVVTQIATDFAALKAVLSGVALPGVLSAVINAVTTLLPYILAAVGVVSAPAASASKATGMSADVARLILKAA